MGRGAAPTPVPRPAGNNPVYARPREILFEWNCREAELVRRSFVCMMGSTQSIVVISMAHGPYLERESKSIHEFMIHDPWSMVHDP